MNDEQQAPPAENQEVIETRIAKLKAQIEALSLANPIRKDIAAIKGAHKLSEYLDEKDWWRLYILPADQQAAKVSHKDDPGSSYKKDFGKYMVAGYKYVWEESAITESDLDWKLYAKLFLMMTPRTEKYAIKDATPAQKVWEFSSNETLAPELLDVVILGQSLVWDIVGGSLRPKVSGEAIMMHVGAKSGFMWRTSYDWNQVPFLANAAFDTFHAEINQAHTRWEQLLAIAKLIRILHIMHLFTDGNGRLNVYTILPYLLLQHGFGLPLGGANYMNLDLWALNDMFSGGYSLDQMAAFLWHAQDFGKKDLTNSILSH